MFCRSVPFDVRRTKVDFDISSKEYFDEKVIESTLSQATKRGRLGSFLVDAQVTCRSIEGEFRLGINTVYVEPNSRE